MFVDQQPPAHRKAVDLLHDVDAVVIEIGSIFDANARSRSLPLAHFPPVPPSRVLHGSYDFVVLGVQHAAFVRSEVNPLFIRLDGGPYLAIRHMHE